MAAASPSAESGADSELGSARGEALSHITAELASISANKLTKNDKTNLVMELRAAIREEIMAVRKDLTALEDRVTELERENLQALQHSQAADHATARQGSLFTHILGEEAPDEYNIERAHRALRPPRRDGLPRDVICCLLSFQLKDAIMRAARPQRIIFQDSPISLFLRALDLPPVTIRNWILDQPPPRLDHPEAPQLLRTQAQREAQPVRWGGPHGSEE
ncbi:Hypothetical predicted protein [Pelobates cultripes]|uniref:Uncharacterized protein n=1 Tax=Pelobates cultripes TaxID=61616 RepID=A0AAD1VK64_PELCU|nr:Hypothetical predicted protein [Pelobates cultripes]